MKTHDTIPAEAERPCDCCKRIHRKLYPFRSWWLGKSCKEAVERYQNDKNINSAYWHGYEKQYQRVAAMK